jgi:hypothetical protein
MNRGEVVEIDWQFSDLTGSTQRPPVGAVGLLLAKLFA